MRPTTDQIKLYLSHVHNKKIPERLKLLCSEEIVARGLSP
jgi:hypothetical protein